MAPWNAAQSADAPFQPDVRPSMSLAFADHLLKAHKPGQTTEDFNQAPARIVREATDDK